MIDVGRDQVARVMPERGIEGKLRGRRSERRSRTTLPSSGRAICCDATSRRRRRTRRVCDITNLRTWNGFLYLGFVLDCYSLRIVGWQVATHMRTELILDALEMATGLRRPQTGLIAHSDRGSQPRLDEIGTAPSVDSSGDVYITQKMTVPVALRLAA